MPISSDTLFHFTDHFDTIRRILQVEFQPRFCWEDQPICHPDPEMSDRLDGAIPMVCFCDIPLSQITAHMGRYGSYGLGLSKEWGLQNGVAPVMYAFPRSPVTGSIYSSLLFELSHDLNGMSAEAFSRLWNDIHRIACYIKAYEGPYKKGTREWNNVRFYDEREWRWIPNMADTANGLRLMREEYDNPGIRDKANRDVGKKYRLRFEPSDIKYIIVAREDEVLPMIHAVEQIKEKYSADEKRLLTSRVISAERIAADF